MIGPIWDMSVGDTEADHRGSFGVWWPIGIVLLATRRMTDAQGNALA